jgi:hypothetical protein
MNTIRDVIWFSCGAASAVMAYIVKKQNPGAVLVYCDTGGEHEDNRRFMADVEKWLNASVVVLRSEKYTDHFDVIEKTRYVNGPAGARCTAELKKKLRYRFQQPNDAQYFGYTASEKGRAEKFCESHPEVTAKFPLIERGITKEDCLGVLVKNGIEVPVMYKFGFRNNNCIGCVKGGAGYWNKIREVFPEKFSRMAKLEREVGASCIRGQYLDELDPTRGTLKDLSISCDFVCAMLDSAIQDLVLSVQDTNGFVESDTTEVR